MREAGRLVARGLQLVREMAGPGVKAKDIDIAVEKLFRSEGGVPLFKGYGAASGRPAFPATICASFNEEIVHGIPGRRKLAPGDIFSVDMGVRLGSYCGDAAVTVAVEPISSQARRLLDVTERALDIAVDSLRPGIDWRDVAAAIQEHVESEGFSIVRDFTGHGIGREMHEEPQLPNYATTKQGNITIEEGMTLAVEPMVNAEAPGAKVQKNGWTAVTVDGSLSAHFEHTVAVTADGAEILTAL